MDNTKANSNNSDVQLGTDNNVKLKPNRPISKKALFLLTGLFLVIVILFSQYVIKRYNQEKAISAIPKGLSTQQKAIYLSDKNNYEAAQTVWNKQLESSNSKTDKLNVYYQQSAIALKFGKYNDANKYANKAEQIDSNSATAYVAFAHIAEKQGDVEKARDYWRQAITKLDPNAPGYNLIKRDYQESLNSLK